MDPEAADNLVPSPLVPFLPLRGLVAFPHETYPIYIGRSRSIGAVGVARARSIPILLVTQKDAKISEPSSADLYAVGTLGMIVQQLRLPEGTIKALVEGKKRARVSRSFFDGEFFRAEAEEIDEVSDRSASSKELMRAVVSAFDLYARRDPEISPEISSSIASIEDPSTLGDKIAGCLRIELAGKQALLETISPVERLEKILGYMRAPN